MNPNLIIRVSCYYSISFPPFFSLSLYFPLSCAVSLYFALEALVVRQGSEGQTKEKCGCGCVRRPGSTDSHHVHNGWNFATSPATDG
jgi:hypothetical protein